MQITNSQGTDVVTGAGRFPTILPKVPAGLQVSLPEDGDSLEISKDALELASSLDESEPATEGEPVQEPESLENVAS